MAAINTSPWSTTTTWGSNPNSWPSTSTAGNSFMSYNAWSISVAPTVTIPQPVLDRIALARLAIYPPPEIASPYATPTLAVRAVARRPETRGAMRTVHSMRGGARPLRGRGR